MDAIICGIIRGSYIRRLVLATRSCLRYTVSCMKRNWKQLQRDDKRAQWAGIYVTMNRKGVIAMNRSAHEKMGKPEAFHIFYDEANHAIGLKPTARTMRNAYPATKSGRHGGRRVGAYRLITEFALDIKDTLLFPDAEIDTYGVLILNLRTAEISKRVLNHPRRRKA
jgi:hypothetical protein